MAAMAASIAETVTGMQRVIAQDDYESDSDETYLQMSNYDNKLKRKFSDFSSRIENRHSGTKRYRKTVKHAGYAREILRKNPKRCDDNGNELATDDEDESADTRVAEENPYAGIKLEYLLAPLTSAATLAHHPSLSEVYSSTALTSMAQHANQVLQRERRSLAHAKRMLIELRGDGSWIPAGKLREPNDDLIFDTTKLYHTILENAPTKALGRHNPKPAGVPASTMSTTLKDGNDMSRETKISNTLSNKGKSHLAVQDDVTNPDTDRKEVDKDEVLELITKPRKDHDSAQDVSHELGSDSILASVEKEPRSHDQGISTTPLIETQGDDEEMQTPPRRITRAQAQADRASASPESTPDEAWHPPQIHPLFLIPSSARPDQDLGLPPIEAQDTRHLLSLYVQKQEEVCRGAQKLFEGLLKAHRQRQTVSKWCKAEAHIGEMSDGEDWYDKEEWGLEEGLRKGQIEEEEESTVQGKKTRRGRG